MIIVTVYLASAVDASRNKELARMVIANEGDTIDGVHFNYHARTFKGRSKDQLDRGTTQRNTRIEQWARDRHHVWNLVEIALRKMGYGSQQ